MPPLTRNPAFPTDVFMMVVSYLRGLPLDVAALAAAQGIELDVDRGIARLTRAQFLAFFNRVSELMDDPWLSLAVGRDLHSHAHGHILAVLIQNSPSLEVALNYFARYHNLVYGSALNGEVPTLKLVKISGELILAIEEAMPRERGAVNHEACLFSSAVVAFIRHLSQQRVMPSLVQFDFPRPDDLSLFSELFGEGLRFSAPWCQVHYSLADLEAKPPFSDPHLFLSVQRHGESLLQRQYKDDYWSRETAWKLNSLAYSGKTDIQSVASALNISVRTLQAKLKAEGTSFREVWNGLRRELAQHYLTHTSEPVSSVALLLGFSEQGAFTKAFKQWFQCTPSDYRYRANIDKTSK